MNAVFNFYATWFQIEEQESSAQGGSGYDYKTAHKFSHITKAATSQSY
jgi:hypothetical protein